PRDDQRSARRHDLARPGGHHDDGRHPRDGLRPPGGPPRDLHGRGSHRRTERSHDVLRVAAVGARESLLVENPHSLMEVLMRRVLALILALPLAAGLAAPALAETTLEKIGRTGVLTIGTRTGSPPFAYVNRNNEWVGFSIDLVEQGVLPAIAKKVGKPV